MKFLLIDVEFKNLYMLKKLGNFYMKYYATTGIVSSVLATKWATMVIGVMIILSIYGEHTPMNITKSIALSYALMLPVGLAINYFFPKVYSKSNKDVVIAMLAPLGNLGLLIGK